MSKSLNRFFKRHISCHIKHLCVVLLTLSGAVVAQSDSVESRQIATAQGTIERPVLSPDGQTVFYLDETGGGTSTELFSVSVTDGTPTVLNTSLVAGGDIRQFEITPDGQQIVYLADQITDGVVELFIMPITGGTSTRLHSALSVGEGVINFELSSDGTQLVYEQFGSFGRAREALFSVQLDSGRVTNLTSNSPLAFARINNFAISPNNQRVVFTTFDNDFASNGLLSVKLDGTAFVQLNINISGNDEISSEFLLTPDSANVIYGLSTTSSSVLQLFIAPIDGSERATAITERSNSVNGLFDLSITPDSQFVIARSRLLSGSGSFDLVKIPVFADQAIERLSQTFASTSTGVDEPLISPDGRFVVYLADDGTAFNLFQVPISGGTPVQLNPLRNDTRVQFKFAITPNSQSVVYALRFMLNDSDFQQQLFATSITGGAPTALSEALDDDEEGVVELNIADNSQQLVFKTPNANALFLASLSSEEPPQEPSCFVIPTKNNKFATICL